MAKKPSVKAPLKKAVKSVKKALTSKKNTKKKK